MKNVLGLSLGLILLPPFLFSQEGSLNTNNPFLSIVTDSTWMESSTVYGFSSMIFPWPGAILYPYDSTYTQPVQTGNTYNYSHIAPLEEAEAIVSLDDVRYFRKTFRIEEITDISVRIRAYMDDNIEIRINNIVVARNALVSESNFKGVPHDLVINSDSTRYNGFENHDAFNFVSPKKTSEIFQPGTNEIVVAIRNMRNNMGGFRLKMELSADSTILNPLGVAESRLESTKINFYPNPAGSQLYVNLSNYYENFDLQFFNLNGSLIEEHFLQGGTVTELNTSNLAKGIYFLTFSNGQTFETGKLVIE